MPMLKSDRLVGAIAYADGQFDDARYNLALLQTFTKSGGEALNYARVVGFKKNGNGQLVQARVHDGLSGHYLEHTSQSLYKCDRSIRGWHSRPCKTWCQAAVKTKQGKPHSPPHGCSDQQ